MLVIYIYIKIEDLLRSVIILVGTIQQHLDTGRDISLPFIPNSTLMALTLAYLLSSLVIRGLRTNGVGTVLFLHLHSFHILYSVYEGTHLHFFSAIFTQ